MTPALRSTLITCLLADVPNTATKDYPSKGGAKNFHLDPDMRQLRSVGGWGRFTPTHFKVEAI